MIPGTQEIRQSCEASWSVMMGRAEAVQQFDLSADGFWRSFTVIFLLVPFYVLKIVTDQRLFLEEHLLQGKELSEFVAGGLQTYFGDAIALGLDWIAFPIVVGLLASSLALKQTFGQYIIVRNWSAVIIFIPQSILNLAFMIGIIPSALLIMLWLPLVGWVLWFHFQVARVAGQCSFSVSIGLVLLDLILSLLIGVSIGRIFGG